MTRATVGPPACWMPLGLLPAGPGTPAMVDWFDLGSLRFDDPFFIETVYRAQARHARDPQLGPFHRQTTMAELLDQAAADPGVAPTGFVFHLARCGSTLLAQMLAGVPEHIVLSEPVPVDLVMRARFWAAISDDSRVVWLQAVVAALARRRQADERRLFVKFDAWHTLELPLIRRAFPDVPWIFLYRDPVEVLVSHDRSRAALTIPGAIPPAVFGLELAEAATVSPDTYAARVTAAIGSAALTHLDALGRLVRYDELPGALAAVLSHFGVPTSDADLASMLAVAREDAKARGMMFVPDGSAKRAEASAELLAAAALVMPVIQRLDEVRRGGAGLNGPEPGAGLNGPEPGTGLSGSESEPGLNGSERNLVATA